MFYTLVGEREREEHDGCANQLTCMHELYIGTDYRFTLHMITRERFNVCADSLSLKRTHRQSVRAK